MEERKIWTTGRKGCVACVTAFIYENGSIVADGDEERITEFQMRKALRQEFPNVEFTISHGRGDGLFMEGGKR